MENNEICNFPNCRNRLKKNSFKCKCCHIFFCSDSCLLEHMIIQRENNKRGGSGKMLNKAKSSRIEFDYNPLSIFIKPGKILKEMDKNSYFDLSNFDKVRSPVTGSKILGNGAFGDVYLVKNKIDGKMYALKQMDKSRLLSVGIKPEIVYREINIHIKLIHDHIARLYAYHEDIKAFYLIVEYVENGTLFSIIQKSGGMSEDDAFIYFIQVASALYFLHTNNLMHRDLKPENCLLDKEGNIKLCDFGWAVESKNESRATFCGTYEYMAPEIIREMPYGQAIDVWSLGILLYELLHSYSPFSIKKQEYKKEINYDSSVEVLKNILKSNLTFDKSLTDECKSLIRDLLSQDVDNRITIKDVFEHPWVMKYEDRINKKLLKKPIKKIKKYKTLNNNNSNKSKYVILPDNNKSLDSIKDLKLERNDQVTVLKENLVIDNLFDSVLDMVQGKNKTKRKSHSDLNYRFSIDNIYKTIEDEIKKQNSNKIVLKIEKVNNMNAGANHYYEGTNLIKHKGEKEYLENENKDEENKILDVSPIKTLLYDESTFSMYKEMQEIDRRIDEKSKKYENLKKRTDKMKQRINKYNNNKNCNSNDPGHEFLNFDSCNNFENLKTQPQSVINHSEEYVVNNNKIVKTQRAKKQGYNKFQDEFFDNYNNIRTTNIKHKKASSGGTKTLKQLNDQLEDIYNINSNEVSKLDNSNLNPLKILNKSEISTQTETPVAPPSFFARLLNSFKCG